MFFHVHVFLKNTNNVTKTTLYKKKKKEYLSYISYFKCLNTIFRELIHTISVFSFQIILFYNIFVNMLKTIGPT